MISWSMGSGAISGQTYKKTLYMCGKRFQQPLESVSIFIRC